MNSGNFHVLWVISGQHSCLVNEFMPCIGTFEYTKVVTLHCTEVGGGKDQGPTAQVTHLRLN